MIDLDGRDIGRKVIYRPRGLPMREEEGVVTSVRRSATMGTIVFVRYGSDSGSKGTKAEDLHYSNPQ